MLRTLQGIISRHSGEPEIGNNQNFKRIFLKRVWRIFYLNQLFWLGILLPRHLLPFSQPVTSPQPILYSRSIICYTLSFRPVFYKPYLHDPFPGSFSITSRFLCLFSVAYYLPSHPAFPAHFPVHTSSRTVFHYTPHSVVYGFTGPFSVHTDFQTCLPLHPVSKRVYRNIPVFQARFPLHTNFPVSFPLHTDFPVWFFVT